MLSIKAFKWKKLKTAQKINFVHFLKRLLFDSFVIKSKAKH